jgi:hypothetical protein
MVSFVLSKAMGRGWGLKQKKWAYYSSEECNRAIMHKAMSTKSERMVVGCYDRRMRGTTDMSQYTVGISIGTDFKKISISSSVKCMRNIAIERCEKKFLQRSNSLVRGWSRYFVVRVSEVRTRLGVPGNTEARRIISHGLYG